jgi:predicted dehydrogenase
MQQGLPEIGVGVLGYAFMGKAHSNALKTLAYMLDPPPAIPRLVGIAGRTAVAVREAAERYGYDEAYTDWHDLVANPRVQLFDNSGPNEVHAEPTIAAAQMGKHVLCEKPLGRDAAEAHSLLEAVERSGVKHMAGFNYRFVPAVRHAYDLIHSGALGTIYHFRARYLQDWLANPAAPMTWRLRQATAGSGVLGDLGSHAIDLARFLIGEPTAVMAATRTFIDERPLADGLGTGTVDVDDAFATVVTFDSGALGTIEASRVSLGRRNHFVLEVNGSLGSLRFNLERLNELEVYTAESGGFADVLVTERHHPYMASWWPPGHIIGWEHTFVHELAHFIDAIVNDRDVAPFGATFVDGYRAAVVGDAIARSAETGRRIEIVY